MAHDRTDGTKRRWPRRVALAVAGLLGGILLLAGIALLVITQTDWGRERVRRYAVDALNTRANGTVSIGRASGNLLTGMTLTDFTIDDSTGAPFIHAERISTRYSLRGLLSSRIALTNLELVRPVIVLDRRPGQDWNFVRIFPTDTTAQTPGQRGLGSWILLNDVSVVDGRLTVRNAWEPSDSLTAAQQHATIERALAGDTRLRIERVAGGYQSIMDARKLYAWLPRLRLADPDSADIFARVDSLRASADIFRPRTGEIRDLAGDFRFGEDSIHFADARLALPATVVTAEGAYALTNGGLRVTATSPRLAFADILWLVPEAPEQGGGSFTAEVQRTADALTVNAPALDIRIDESRIAGRLGITLGDTVGLNDTDLRLTSLDTRLIERFTPALDLPRHGTVDGRVVLGGSPAALRLDADLAFTEPRSGRSEVRAVGEVGTGDRIRLRNVRVSLDPVRMDLVRAFAPALTVGGTLTGDATLDGVYPGYLAVDGDLTLREAGSGRSRVLVDGGIRSGDRIAFESLALRFDPLQVALARTFAPDLPLGGTIHGRAVLNGTPDHIAATGDLVHIQEGERSHVVGAATIAGSAIRADLRLLPVSLVTVGRFAPAAQLYGTTTGDLRVRADAREIRADADLLVADSGSIRFDAWLDRSATRYDVSAWLAAFDASGVSARAPETLLTGLIGTRGTGFEPATMTADIRAELTGPAVARSADGEPAKEGVPLRADSIYLDAAVGGGLMDIERTLVRLASAQLDASGTFGLVEGRRGELRYGLRVDSLSDFAGYLPPDTTLPASPRPALQVEAIARARADSLRFARETEVRRMATGEPALRPLEVDTVRPLPRDSLSGSIRAEGTLRGGVAGFDLSGTAALERFVGFGNAAASGDVRYDARAALTPAARYDVTAAFASVYAAGFAFDSVTANVQYRGDFESGDRGGTVDVRAVQDERRDYRVRADVVLALDRSLVRFDELALRFDTTHWTATRPSSIAWGERGIEVGALELVSGSGGRIAADGRVPPSGEAALDVALRNVQIGDIATLLQADSSATGLLTLDAALRGTAEDPRVDARFALTAARMGGSELPDIAGTAGYAAARATAAANATGRSGRTLLEAEGTVPFRFTLQPFAFDRVDGPLDVTARADSLPLDALPSFTDAVRDVNGRVIGDFAVRGTWAEPDLSGQVDLDLGTFRVVPLGVTFMNIGGTVRLADDRATIDSLVAHSRGVIRVDGTVDLAAVDSPVFDLRLDARDARLLDNERGTVTTDAELTARGPLARVDVGGTVAVKSGVFYIPEPQKRLVPLDDPAVALVADTAAPSTRELLPARNPLLDNLRVNVNVTVARDTWVRNTDANVEIYTPADEGALRVVLDQSAGLLGLQGRLNMDRGEYNAFSRRFVLTRGGVTFQGGPEIDPLLHIIARHEVQLPGREAIDINVHVGGSLSQPTLSLESDAEPPISQTDLLSYLAFGRSSTSLFQQQGSSLSGSSGGGNLAGGVASLATRQLAGVALDAVVDEFESGAARQVGADVFRITPADLPAELSFGGFETVLLGTEVEVGKYFARRWFVAGQARPTLVRPGARVEYVTPRGFRWSLSYQPRFLPRDPSFDLADEAPRTRGVLGMFLRWERRF